MKNSKDIQEAIKAYLASTGRNSVDLAIFMEVSQASTSRWITGEAKSIKNSHWIKLEPLIRPHIKPIVGVALPFDERILLEAYRNFTDLEKEAAVKEFIIKAEVKNMKATG